MRKRSRVAIRILLAIVGLGFIGSIAAVSAAELRSGFHKRLDDAQLRWSNRQFDHYRIVIEDDSGRCQQDALVENEQVVKRIGNTCRIPPRSVSNLFRLIEGTPPSRYQCVEHGCACDTVMSVTTDYDAVLGYPRLVRFVWQVRTNWRHRDYWSYLWEKGTPLSCRATTFSRAIKVISLTPLRP